VREGGFSRTITVLPVHDIETACEWYAAALEMATAYLHEGDHPDEVTNYAILARDGVAVHLILDEPAPYGDTWTLAGTGYLYLKVRGVRSIFDSVRAKGIETTQDLEVAPWGAIGFELRDPSGNLIRVEEDASG